MRWHATLLLSLLPAIVHSRDHRSFPNQTYYTESFTAPGLELFANGHTAPGHLFYGVVGHGYVPEAPIIMENNGELVWYGGENIPTHNFRVQTLHNQKVVSYWTGNDDHFGHGYGSIDIFDKTYTLTHSLCLKANIVTPRPAAFPGNRRNPCFWDSHESYITNRGTVIGTVFNVTHADLRQFGGPADGWVFDALFYEVDIDTGKTLFKWSALENIPLKESNYFGHDPKNPLHIGRVVYGHTQSNPWDFFHINSVQPIDGGYLVNSRMTWSFYKVNGKTGSVEWRLQGNDGGDFTLGPGIFFSWEHDPRLISKKGDIMQISLFNNDNINSLYYGKNQSTGYLLEVDLKNKHVRSLADLKQDSDKVYVAAEGSYQVLSNGHAILGYGSQAVIKEFDKSGVVIYNAQFAPLSRQDPDEDGGKDVHSYRAYRFEWDAQPATPPKTVSFAQGDGTTKVYMSWNGATNYDSWNIYAGNSRGALTKVASGVAKKGFETSHTIKTKGRKKFNYIQVEAMSKGKSLMKSKPVQVKDAKKSRRG